MEDTRYNVILDTLPETATRLEVLFRQAGDGFLQIEYGRVQRASLLDSFRIQTVDARIREAAPKGFIETLPGIRTNLIHFDPEILDVQVLIEQIKGFEEELTDVDHIVMPSRLIHLPIAFEDSETKKSVAKYVKEVRPDAPNVIDGYNLEYIAMCNGMTAAEVKETLLTTLAAFDLRARRQPGCTGVWVDGAKIASIGIGVRHWVSWHGFALNVATDLRAFDTIVPCGLAGVTMTSMEALLGAPVSLAAVEAVLIDAFARCFSSDYQGDYADRTLTQA